MTHPPTHCRKGVVLLLICFLLVPLLTLLAFAVDYGFLLQVRTDLQRSADQAALAAVRDLLPDENGNQDRDKVRKTLRDYAQSNLTDGFSIRDADIEIGRYNRSTVYKSLELLATGKPDTVRVTVRRDSMANSSVALYFARIFDRDQADVAVSSAAVLQSARYLGPGTPSSPSRSRRILGTRLVSAKRYPFSETVVWKMISARRSRAIGVPSILAPRPTAQPICGIKSKMDCVKVISTNCMIRERFPTRLILTANRRLR